MTRVPKYQRIYHLLRQRILSGSYASGKFPSLDVLAQEFGVSLGTINRAVKQLEAEALVNCQSGRGGTQVNEVFQEREKELFGERINLWQDIRFFVEHKVTLRFQMTVQSALEHDLFAAILAGFQNKYPWIDLKLQDPRALQDGAYEADQYDLCLLLSSELNRYISNGAVLNLSACWQAFGCPELSIPGYHDLLGSAADYVVPVSFNTPLFYYNPGLLPKVPTTLEELSNQVLALQKSGCLFSSIMGLLSLLHCYIGSVPDKIHAKQSRGLLAEALQFWKCCYYLPTSWNNFDPMESSQAFAEGKTAFLISYYLNKNRNEHRKINWQVAGMPSQQSALLVMELCAVSSKSRHPKEAWLFARYLLSKEVQDLFCRKRHNPPTLEESFQGAFREYSTAEYMALQKIRRHMELDRISAFNKSATYMQLHNELKAYFQQQLNLDEIIDHLQSNLTELFKLDRIFDS
jgi:DNA-binding transcriptional regulator YhcF (GntR family)